MRIAFGGGLSASDPLQYLEYSHRIANGSYQLDPHHFSTRFAVTAPIALCFRWFGVSVASATLWPLACSLVTLVTLYLLGRHFGGDAVGCIAAGTFALLPLDVSESSNVLPDPILATFATLCVYCFVLGEAAASRGVARACFVASGLFLWCAYSAKIVGALLAVVLALHVVLGASGRGRVRDLAWVAAGTLVLLVPELVWYWIETSDPLFPLGAIADVHESSVGVRAANGDLQDRLLKAYPRKTLLPNEHFGLLAPLLVAATLLLLPQARRFRVLYLWIAVLGAYLNFGSSNLTRYVAIPANTRYLQPIVIPGLVLFGVLVRQAWLACARLARPRLARAGVLSIGAFLVLTMAGASFLHSGRSFTHLTAQEGLALTVPLREADPAIVYADDRTAAVVRFAFAYEPPFELRPFPPIDPAQPPADYVACLEPGACLLLNWREIYKAGEDRRLSRAQSWALRDFATRADLDRVALACRRPADLYYGLARLPCLRAGLRRDQKLEHFLHPERPRGTWLVRLPRPHEPAALAE